MTAKKVDYITPHGAQKLAGDQFPRLKHGFLAVGTLEGRAYRVGYVVPQGYYVEWDIADLENPAKTNPPTVKIYNRVIKIYASKAGMKHNCDPECRAHGHNYVHEFAEKACIYGLPDGSFLVK
jgi:hypothetical protein